MPPQPKFTREQIVDAAMGIVRAGGIDKLTARELARALGSSSRPIFTVFKDMDDLKTEVRIAAGRYLESYIADAAASRPSFEQMGILTVRFAQTEPRLFELLMMEAGKPCKLDDLVQAATGPNGVILQVIQASFGLDEAQAFALFRQMWLTTYAIGVLCARGICDFTDEELAALLEEDLKGLLTCMKMEKI